MKIIGIIVAALAVLVFLTVVVLWILRMVDDSRVNRIWNSLQVSGEPKAVFFLPKWSRASLSWRNAICCMPSSPVRH